MEPCPSQPVPAGQPGKKGIGHNNQQRIEEDVQRIVTSMNLPRPLTPATVSDQRWEFGPNVISTRSSASWYSLLLSALLHPFNILLAILATTSGVNQEFDSMGVMAFMIVTSTTIRFFQEYRSARAAQGLSKLISNTVHVFRDQAAANGASSIREKEIPIEELVPRDWVNLTAGALVPADIVLLQSKDLLVSQSSLTGEAIPVEKFWDSTVVSKQFDAAGSPLNRRIAAVKEPSPNAGTLKANHKLHLHQGDPRLSVRQWCANLLRSLFGLPIYRTGSGTDSSLAPAELDNPGLCYAGTSVVSGTGIGLVLATGSATYFGSMAKQLANATPPNAFQLGVRRISWIFFLTMLCLVPPVLLIQGFVNKDWREAFLFSLAVAVGLTPEMLPMIVSATLARGAYRLSQKKCIVKNMDSIINLGGMDVLCTDKTGTLTENCVSLTHHVDFWGQSAFLPVQLGFLNSYFQTGLKNLMDEAVIVNFNGTEGGSETPSLLAQVYRRIDELPFDFVRRRMSVLLARVSPSPDSGSSDETLLISKGAVDEMLSVCSHACLPSKPSTNFEDRHMMTLPPHSACQPLTEEMRAQLTSRVTSFSAGGLRVIAVAFKRYGSDQSWQEKELQKSEESGMTFAGFLGFQDPVKQSAAPAINTLIQNGVCVKVLTGDSDAVCRKVCEDIQLPVSSIVSSHQLDGASEAQVAELADSGTIFAKLTPLQKADIVRALRRTNHVVGFLGDGINDAPALAEADIGISVDNGTDIARDAANIILLQKDLRVVADGVLEGRTTYGNTMKYIVMAMSSNFGNVFSVLLASAWLPFVPMQALHILAQNLLYDISQIAIPWDRMDKEFLAVPHCWSMKRVLLFMVFMGPWSSIFDITTFAYMYFYHKIKTPDDDVILFQTAWFTVGLLTQTLIVHMIRTPRIPFVQSIAALPLLVMTMLIMGVGLALPYVPAVSTYLDFVYLPGDFYGFLAGVLILYCIAAQFAKVVYIKLFKNWY